MKNEGSADAEGLSGKVRLQRALRSLCAAWIELVIESVEQVGFQPPAGLQHAISGICRSVAAYQAVIFAFTCTEVSDALTDFTCTSYS